MLTSIVTAALAVATSSIAAVALVMTRVANKSLKKGALLLALFLLTSCRKPCYQWEFDKSLTCRSSANSARIWFTTGDCDLGMKFEILRNNEGWWGYLSLSMFSFPEEGSCDQLPITNISITIGDNLYPYTAHLLTGRQRLLLPEEATFQIIDALMNGERVLLTAGSHTATLLPNRFEKSYQRLSKVPL